MPIPRATLLWWPMRVLPAVWGLRRSWARSACLCGVAPVAAVLTVAFLSGRRAD
ncbi:hypothetical protein ACWDZ4_00915 [Streptomyces sp. NPDC003016]